MDGSHHAWFEERRGTAVLMVLIDDAMGRVTAQFFENESLPPFPHDLNKVTFRTKGTNLFLGYRESTGACKFVDYDKDADFKMEYLPKDKAWTAFNNRWAQFLWMYSDPYPYVRGGIDGETKARWVFEEAK